MPDVKAIAKMIDASGGIPAGKAQQSEGRMGARKVVQSPTDSATVAATIVSQRVDLQYCALPPETSHQYIQLQPEDLDSYGTAYSDTASSTPASPRSVATSTPPYSPRTVKTESSPRPSTAEVTHVEWEKDDDEESDWIKQKLLSSPPSPPEEPRKAKTYAVMGKLPAPPASTPPMLPRENDTRLADTAVKTNHLGAYLIPLDSDDDDSGSGPSEKTALQSRMSPVASSPAAVAAQPAESAEQKEARLWWDFSGTPQAVNEKGENIAVFGYLQTQVGPKLEPINPENATYFETGRTGIDRFGNTDCLRQTLVRSAAVNANHVRFEAKGEKFHYIAAQAPARRNEANFYQMVEKENVEDMVVIINDNDLFNNVDIQRHWPTKPEDGVINGYRCIRAEELTEQGSPGVIKYILQKEGSKNVINLYQITRWGDHQDSSTGETLNTIAYINTQRAARQQARKSPLGPVLVHCNAGVGRTGTFLGIMGAIATGNYNPREVLTTLRQQRAGAIQQFDQYKMMVNALEILQHREAIKRVDARLLGKPFYEPNVTRAEAEQLLGGKQEGAFLVRKSSAENLEKPFVVSHVIRDAANHLVVTHSKASISELFKFLAKRSLKT